MDFSRQKDISYIEVIEQLIEQIQRSTNVDDMLTIIPEFRSYHIGEKNELSYVTYHSQEYLNIIKKCILAYFEKLTQCEHNQDVCTDLRQLANVLTTILPKNEIWQNLRNNEFETLSKILDLENQGIFIFNPETQQYEQNCTIITTISQLKQRLSFYCKPDICVLFNHNGHWRCLVIRNNLAIYSDGIIGNMSGYTTQICDVVSNLTGHPIRTQYYTCTEQKDKRRCGLYALRTALFSMQQSSSDFEIYFHKLERLECIIQYIEEKIIRNIIKVDRFKDNEPEKYQEKMVKCFVFYGLLKYQRHFNEKNQINLEKLCDTLTEKHIFINFRYLSDNYCHIIDLAKYKHVVIEMNKYLQNIQFKRSFCEKLLTIKLENGQNMCDMLNKFPSGTISYSDFMRYNETIGNTLIRKKNRLRDLCKI